MNGFEGGTLRAGSPTPRIGGTTYSAIGAPWNRRMTGQVTRIDDRPGLRLVVCDNHRLFAESLAVVFEASGHSVVACTDDTEAVIRAVKRHNVDVCILDLAIGSEVHNVIRRIRSLSPDTKCMLLTAHRDPEAAAAARDAGAVALEHKTCPLDQVVDRVREVSQLTGETTLGPLGDAADDPWTRDPLARFLTPREREVLVGLTEGVSTRKLAERLGVSVATVRSHIQSVLAKLGVHSRLEAVVYVSQRSLPVAV